MNLSPVVWQHLLALELPANRAFLLAQELAASRLDPLTQLRSHPSIAKKERDRLTKLDMRAYEKAMKGGARVLVSPGSEFGDGFSYACPAAFVLGDDRVFEAPKVAIVGTRAASTYGKAVAMKFAEQLSAAGVVVVSGGALGIDTAAHQGALSGGTGTVAILAGGIDRLYPASNRQLFDRIVAEGGLLMSQYAVGAPPTDYKFLLRNKLVAAFADAVLVVESPERSGALSTAHAAAEMNKLVFVVPANITNPKFRGSHALIREGAMLTDHPDQILESMGIEPRKAEIASHEYSEEHQRILELLASESLGAEKIIEVTGYASDVVMAALTEMEITGELIRDGMGYSKAP